MLKVHGRTGSSNSAKVFWLLAELDVEYELILTGGQHGGNGEPEFRALNPFGKVPVLLDGDLAVWESNSVLRYLAAKFDARHLWPTELGPRSQVDRWMDWASISLTPPLTRLRKSRAAGNGDADLETVQMAFLALDERLANSNYLAGDTLTLADITAAPSVHRWFLLEGDLIPTPNVSAYADRLQQHPAYARHILNSLK